MKCQAEASSVVVAYCVDYVANAMIKAGATMNNERSLDLSALVDGGSCSIRSGLRRSKTRRIARHGLTNEAG